MEAAKLLSSSTSADKTRQMSGNQKSRVNQTRRFISSRHQTENFIPTTASKAELIYGGGMFLNPPPFSLSSSFPGHFRQPPLLPLPVSRTFHSLPTRGSKSSPYSHSLCPTPTNRKAPSSSNNKPKERTPKKQPPLKRQPDPVQKVYNLGRKQERPEESEVISGNGLIVGSMKRVESDPKCIKKDVDSTGVLLGDFNVEADELEKLYGSVFRLSPPPSSLPLPKFSLRPPKVVSCTVEAVGGGVEDGATDNLCRLLKLR